MKFAPAIELPQLLIVSSMFLISIASWNSAPAQMAVHWSASGQPDRFGGKTEGLLLIPTIAAVIYVGGYLLQGVLAANAQVRTSYIMFRFAYLLTLTVAYAVVRLTARGYTVPLGPVVIPTVLIDTLAVANFIWRAISASHS